MDKYVFVDLSNPVSAGASQSFDNKNKECFSVPEINLVSDATKLPVKVNFYDGTLKRNLVFTYYPDNSALWDLPDDSYLSGIIGFREPVSKYSFSGKKYPLNLGLAEIFRIGAGEISSLSIEVISQGGDAYKVIYSKDKFESKDLANIGDTMFTILDGYNNALIHPEEIKDLAKYRGVGEGPYLFITKQIEGKEVGQWSSKIKDSYYDNGIWLENGQIYYRISKWGNKDSNVNYQRLPPEKVIVGIVDSGGGVSITKYPSDSELQAHPFVLGDGYVSMSGGYLESFNKALKFIDNKNIRNLYSGTIPESFFGGSA